MKCPSCTKRKVMFLLSRTVMAGRILYKQTMLKALIFLWLLCSSVTLYNRFSLFSRIWNWNVKLSKFCNFFGSASHWGTSYAFTNLTLNLYVPSPALYYGSLILRPADKPEEGRAQPVLPLQEQHAGVAYYMPYPFDIFTHLIATETIGKGNGKILSHFIQSLNVRAGVPSQGV